MGVLLLWFWGKFGLISLNIKLPRLINVSNPYENIHVTEPFSPEFESLGQRHFEFMTVLLHVISVNIPMGFENKMNISHDSFIYQGLNKRKTLCKI